MAFVYRVQFSHLQIVRLRTFKPDVQFSITIVVKGSLSTLEIIREATLDFRIVRENQLPSIR